MSDLTAGSATCSARLGPRSCTRAPHNSGRHVDAEGSWLGHTPPRLTLADFLRARFAEDEAIVHMVLGSYATNGVSWDCPATGVVQGPEGLLGTGDGPLAQHIARWDPARVLAECDARRRIVEAESRRWRTKASVYAETFKAPDDMVTVSWLDEHDRPRRERISEVEFRDRFTEPSPPSDTLKLLALPYADHPDYLEEWRP